MGVVTGGGGAYAPPTTWERITIADQVVAAATQVTLALSHGAGSALLSYTDPTQPTIMTAGIYALSVWVQNASNAATETALAQVQGEIDWNVNGFDATGTLSVLAAGGVGNVAVIARSTSGGIVAVSVTNDGNVGVHFAGQALLSRIT